MLAIPVGIASICNAADHFKKPFYGWRGLSKQALIPGFAWVTSAKPLAAIVPLASKAGQMQESWGAQGGRPLSKSQQALITPLQISLLAAQILLVSRHHHQRKSFPFAEPNRP